MSLKFNAKSGGANAFLRLSWACCFFVVLGQVDSLIGLLEPGGCGVPARAKPVIRVAVVFPCLDQERAFQLLINWCDPHARNKQERANVSRLLSHEHFPLLS